MWYIAVRGKKIVEPYLFHIRLFSVLVLHNFYRNIFIIDSIFPEEAEVKKVKCLVFYCCSITESRLTLCDPMDCSKPGLPVLHHLLEFAQLHVHFIGDAVQPSHPLTPSSPSALDLSQHQGKIMNPCSLLFTKIHPFFWFPSVQFSRSVVSDSL